MKRQEDATIETENIVKIGSKVTVLMKIEDEEEKVTFTVKSEGSSEENIVSKESPIGECIFGRELGYEGKYRVNNNVIKVKILEIN